MSENSIANPLNLISWKLSFFTEMRKKNLLPNIRINQSSLLVYLLLISSSFFSYIHVILFSTININFFYLNIYVSTIFFRFNPKTNQKKKAILLLSKKKIYINKNNNIMKTYSMFLTLSVSIQFLFLFFLRN